MIRTTILMVRGSGTDEAGTEDSIRAVREILAAGPFVEVDFQKVPDEQAIVRAKLRLWADNGDVDLVLTLGGIGLALRDRTPEATLEVIERNIPGLPELMRLIGLQKSRMAALWRPVAGVRRQTLIINLPGDPEGSKTALEAVSGLLPNVIETVVEPFAGSHQDSPSS